MMMMLTIMLWEKSRHKSGKSFENLLISTDRHTSTDSHVPHNIYDRTYSTTSIYIFEMWRIYEPTVYLLPSTRAPFIWLKCVVYFSLLTIPVRRWRLPMGITETESWTELRDAGRDVKFKSFSWYSTSVQTNKEMKIPHTETNTWPSLNHVCIVYGSVLFFFFLWRKQEVAWTSGWATRNSFQYGDHHTCFFFISFDSVLVSFFWIILLSVAKTI